MAQVQPMDIDDIENDFDNKENSSHHSNVLPRTPCIEKGHEELDVSELNMKLRYSITPASSPMIKSLNDCENNINNVENGSLTWSLNSTITKPEMVTSLKSLPLQVLATDEVIKERNSCIFHTVEPSCNENNATLSLGRTIDIDENISLPSTSTSAMTTPEATTPTKEIPKHDGSSPIMRGLKSVLNMFRTSQSPISLSESTSTNVVQQVNLSPNDSILNNSENNRSQTVVVSTPISNKGKDVCGSQRISPLKESIIFNEDLERNLEWKDETTIFFKHEKIPIHVLFPPQSCNSKTSKDVAIASKVDNNESKNITEEYMSMSNNGSVTQIGNVTNSQLPSVQNELSTIESDGEFVDCEMIINEEFYNSKLTEKENYTYEKLEHCHINKFNIEENIKQELDNIEAVSTDSVLHQQSEGSTDISTVLKHYETVSTNFENFVNETHSVFENNGDENEMISSNIQNMKKNKISIEDIIPTNVTLCDEVKKYDVEVKENDEKIDPSQVSLPDANNVDFMEFSDSPKNIHELKIKSSIDKEDLSIPATNFGQGEGVATEETCQHINNTNEIKSLQVNDQEINIHTSQQSSTVLVTGQTATSLHSDMHKESMESQVIDTPVNVSSKSISESPKKEYKPASKLDEEKKTEKSTSGKSRDEDFTTIISETNENNLEFKMESIEKNVLKYDNSLTVAETINPNFLSNYICKDNNTSQLHFREIYDLSKDPNLSTSKHVSQNNYSGILTTTINEEKDHQVNELNNAVRVTNSEMVLDDFKENDYNNFEVKKQNAANTVDKNITEVGDQDGIPLDITDKIDMDNIINRGLKEHLNSKKLEERNEKSDKNMPTENNASDKITNFDNAYFNQLNPCAAETTDNIDVNKEAGFESNQCIKTSFSTCERDGNIDKGEGLEQNKELKHTAISDAPDDCSKKSECSVLHTEHEEISTSKVTTQDDRLVSKEVNIIHCKDILKSVNKSETIQLENTSGVNNSLDCSAAGNDGLMQLYFTNVISPTAPYQDTLVENNEVLACQSEKHSNAKYNMTKNEVRSQEKISTSSALQEKENDSTISKNNSPRSVFNLPEISSVFISKPKDNANASAAMDAGDCPEHIFKIPSNNFAHYTPNSDGKTNDGDGNLCVDKNDLNSSDVSTSSKASEATVHEVNTEDEDTVEASFFEAEESNEADKKSEHEDMIDFSDIPARKMNDNVYKGEMFIDAEAFQFLLNQNKSNAVADSGRESLFLKFDPLYAKRMSSDAAAVNQIQKGQSAPKRTSKTFSNIDFYRNSNETTVINSTLETNYDDATVFLSKPMMVVNPAVNSVFSPRNKSLTPPRTNRRSYTFTSPAIAVIDRLLSFSGDNSALNHDVSVTDTRARTNEADLALMQLRELLAEKEINVQGLRSESKELTERLRILETQVKDLETESEHRFRRVDDLNKCLDEKTKMNKGMAVVVEEYERTIASLTAEIEQDKRAHAEERSKLINERNEHNAHLASMTMSFNDLYSKYEKNKQIILNCKANEEEYKQSIEEFDESVLKIQNNYELLKQHATSNLNNKNEEFVKLNRTHEAEILKYGAMIKRKEMHISSLKETLTQKIKANEELTAICDELLNKVA